MNDDWVNQIVPARHHVRTSPEEWLRGLKRLLKMYEPNWTAYQLLRKLGKDMNWLRKEANLNPEQVKRLFDGELAGDVIQ